MKKTDYFYESFVWAKLRYRALRKYGHRCMSCGLSGTSTVLHVDHILPRSKHPDKEMDINNLQVLCEKCNIGKGNEFEDDFTIIAMSKVKPRELTVRQVRKKIRIYSQSLSEAQKTIIKMKLRHAAAVRLSLSIKLKMEKADEMKDYIKFQSLVKDFLNLQRILKDFEFEYVTGKSRGDI